MGHLFVCVVHVKHHFGSFVGFVHACDAIEDSWGVVSFYMLCNI